MPEFSRVLVANRGEIACRVIRSARALGYPTVAVYSDADSEALHVREADRAVRIGPPPAAESYLAIDNILAAARESGADAVHPGYGFLAENAEFARATGEAALVFIGPPAEAIDLMGNKRAAKARMTEAGVPCIPGFADSRACDETLVEKAREIGLPVMVKAAAGGGGRGMRQVDAEDRLAGAIRSARSEARNSFGSDEVILEKAVVKGRHVEVQVFADRRGNAVHLGERDCSIQRRHQKLVEESPSPAVDARLRARMGEAAVAAAQAIGYVGAGTVEFLLAPDGAFYFLEMNTRLQVEHPVTEMITGQDLVAWQLRVAAGAPLPLGQQAITFAGHAIEVRLCTEDTTRDFLPRTGRVLAWRPPSGAGVRVDHGLVEGQSIQPFYDSMQAKIIAWGGDRDQARRRLLRALYDTVFLGIPSNRDFLADVLAHEAFAGGEFDTGFIPAHYPPESLSADPSPTHQALATAILYQDDARRLQRERGFDPDLMVWRNSHAFPVPFKLRRGDTEMDVDLHTTAAGEYEITAGDTRLDLALTSLRDGRVEYRMAGVRHQAHFIRDGRQLFLATAGTTLAFSDALLEPPPADTAGDGQLTAPMDGRILALHCKIGDSVERGAVLAVLEAMKMETELTAGVDGEISGVAVSEGDQVSQGQPLVTIAVPGETTDQ